MAIYSEIKTAADSSHTGNMQFDVKSSFIFKDWHAVKWNCMFSFCFVVCSFESVCRQNYESITLTFVTIGLCTVMSTWTLVNDSFVITWFRIHVSCSYPFCMLSQTLGPLHWGRQTSDLSVPLPTCPFLSSFLFGLLAVYPRNVAATDNMGGSSAGRSEKESWEGEWEAAVSWTKIVITLLSMFGLLPWVYDHQTSCS